MTGFVTNPERNRMRADRRAGAPERAIAQRFGRALTTVQRHVADLPSSAALVAQPGRLSPLARAALIDALASTPIPTLALRYGVSASTVRAIRAEHGAHPHD